MKTIILLFISFNLFANKPLLDNYTINKMGKISLVEKNENSTDLLIAVDGENGKIKYQKNGQLVNDSLVLEKGILNNILEMEDDNDGEHFKGMRINFKADANSAKKTFEFLADHTYIEWSFVAYETADGVRAHVYTSFEKDQEFFGAARVFNILNSPTPIKTLEHYHNHPREEHEVFGKYAFPSEPDINFRNYVLKRDVPNTAFRIRTEGMYIDYGDTVL